MCLAERRWVCDHGRRKVAFYVGRVPYSVGGFEILADQPRSTRSPSSRRGGVASDEESSAGCEPSLYDIPLPGERFEKSDSACTVLRDSSSYSKS